MATTIPGVGDGLFDYGAMFKSSGNLTKTLTTDAVVMRGSPRQGSAARVVFPSTSGTREQVLIAVHGSVDNSTYRLVAQYAGGALSWASGHKSVVVPFNLPRGYKYAKMVFTVTGGTTTSGAGFGAVKAGVIMRLNADYSRTVNWN